MKHSAHSQIMVEKVPDFRYNLSAFIRGWQLVAAGVTHIKCWQKPSLGNHGTSRSRIQATRRLHQATMELSPGLQEPNLATSNQIHATMEPSPGNQELNPSNQKTSLVILYK